MKILSRALLLLVSVAFVMSGCSDNSNSPVNPSEQTIAVPSSPGSLGKGAWVQMATGSGQQWWFGEHWTFAFTAKRDADGICTGEVQAYDRFWEVKFHLKVTHLVVEGNQAYFFGYGMVPTLTWFDPPTAPGPGFGCVLLTDNGQGSKAPLPDQQSYFIAWPDTPDFQDWTENLATATVAEFKAYALTDLGFAGPPDFIMETNMGNTVIRSR